MKSRLLSFCIFSTCFCLTALVCNTYGAAYIKFDGVDGESADANHDKWIDVLSIDWGSHKPSASSSQCRLTDFVFIKHIDKSTPKIMESLCVGHTYSNVVIDVGWSSSTNSADPYLKYELQNVLVTSYSISGVGNDSAGTPTEQISLNFEEIRIRYTPQDSQGTPTGAPVVGSLDFREPPPTKQ